MVKVRELMKQNLTSVQSQETAYAAALMMRVLKIGSVFVKEHDHIIGIVTETDLVRKVMSMNRTPESTSVASVMSAPVIGIHQDRPIWDVADLMEQSSVRHLAVTDDDEAIIGVVSVRDLLHPVAIDDF
ncbi:MAG: CBS domain-containing protein [Nitrospirae bacterium]|nr:CBS domain-containing protein [Nitrospirota bacterium]MDA1305320.1 CBS domain-containing protein [Nitrospirota bacterium]